MCSTIDGMENLLRREGRGGDYYKALGASVADNASIGSGTKIWAGANIFGDVVIGENCTIGAGVYIERGVRLGDNCKVQRGVTLYEGVEAEDYVFFGPNATTTNDRNPRAFGDWELARTYFETGSSIGANATVIAGNRIGALSLIAAGAVVNRDIERCEMVVGNPVRRIGWAGVDGTRISESIEAPEDIRAIAFDPRNAIIRFLEVSRG